MQGRKGPRARIGARAGVLAGLWSGERSGSAWLLWRLAAWPDFLHGALNACIREETEQRRLFLWLPVLFGAGIILYFSAGREPALAAPIVAVALACVLALILRRRGHVAGFRCAVATTFLFAGFAAATVNTSLVSAPVLERQIVARSTAFVETIDLRSDGARLVLRPHSIDGLAGGRTPERVRVTMRWRPDFEAGSTIAATLRLLPPPVQSEPGGYDFARDAYFRGIGAVGNLVSRPQRMPAQSVPLTAHFNAWIDRGRNWLTERIAGVIGGAAGAVAAALVTGKRGTIPESANEDLRAAGIYHIVSISGLHMVLAAGLFLWAIRTILALFPELALRRPIKVWAALAAMAGATAYCLFSGA